MAVKGIELATAYVTVLVKAPGIAKTLNQAIGGADLSAAGKRIGNKISESVGKSIKSQVAKQFADATSAALEKQTSATKKLSDAEHALVKARAQHGTTSAKVTAAEEKLEQLRKSGKASTAELEKAEADLAKAQADAAGTRRGVESAQNSLTAAKRDAAEASKEYSAALEREQSKSERAMAWMPLASARIDEISGKWQNAGTQISGVGESLTNNITKPVAVAGGAVATLVGALGFKRLVGIDTARGQFKGLGMDADAVMEQVDRGVTNTSLSMANGAALAVGILATGSVPLQDLEAQIKRVANVSAAYNVESEHAGYLLNNVLSKNKVTYGDLSQMVQNQIPIITQLADYYGVAAGEIEGMAQRGEISIGDFNKVIDLNAGAAAESYAETWAGVTANIMSNLGRIGAKFMEPTFNLMKDEAAGFLATLKSEEFATFAADIGDRIAAMVTTAAEGIRNLIGWWNSLSDGQKRFITVAGGVLVALGPVLKIVGGLVGGIGKMIAAGKLIVGVFGGWKVASGAVTAAATKQAIATRAADGATKSQIIGMKVGVIAQKAWAGATKMAAAAQVGLRKALDLVSKHPIVAAISLIVGALVYFFTQTELGQKIWGEFTRFLGEAWANVSSFFVTVYEEYLKPVFDAIGTVATWVFNNILKPAFEMAQVQFAILGGIVVGIWENILKPVFDGLGAIVSWLWNNVIKPYLGYVQAQFRVVGAVMSWLWANVAKPVINALATAFQWLWRNILAPVVAGIQLQIRAVGAVLNWLWLNIAKPAIEAIGAVFTWLWQNVTMPVWNGIKNTISSVWNKGIKPVIDTLVKVIKTDPKKAFEAARDAIGSAWSKIKDLAKAPVKFVVQTVINDGLIKTINKVLPKKWKLSEISLPKGFHDGGYTGKLHPRKVAGEVHGDEHVIRSVSRRRIEAHHPGLLDHMNQYGTLPGYRKGGWVHPMPGAAVTSGWRTAGRPDHMGIDLAKPQGTPIRASADGLAVAAGWVNGGFGNTVWLNHGGGIQTRYMHMLANIPVKNGQMVKQGKTLGYEGSTGNSTGPHLHYEVRVGNRDVNPLPYMSRNGAPSPTGPISGGTEAFSIADGLMDWVMKKLGAAGDGMWGQIGKGMAMAVAEPVIEWIKSKIPGHGGAIPTLFDNGGFLPPGRHLVENRTRRPEPILTGAQWDRLTDSRSGDRPVYVQNPFTGEYLLAKVDERADARFEEGMSGASSRALDDHLGVKR